MVKFCPVFPSRDAVFRDDQVDVQRGSRMSVCENCMSPNQEKRKALKPSLSKQMGKWGDNIHFVLSHPTLEMGQCLFCEKLAYFGGKEDEVGVNHTVRRKRFSWLHPGGHLKSLR